VQSYIAAHATPVTAKKQSLPLPALPHDTPPGSDFDPWSDTDDVRAATCAEGDQYTVISDGIATTYNSSNSNSNSKSDLPPVRHSSLNSGVSSEVRALLHEQQLAAHRQQRLQQHRRRSSAPAGRSAASAVIDELSATAADSNSSSSNTAAAAVVRVAPLRRASSSHFWVVQSDAVKQSSHLHELQGHCGDLQKELKEAKATAARLRRQLAVALLQNSSSKSAVNSVNGSRSSSLAAPRSSLASPSALPR
jgi:hypothetical protein